MGEIKLKVQKRQFLKMKKKYRSLSELPIIDFIFTRDKFKDNVLMDNGLQQNFIFRKERLLTNIFNILIIINTFMLYLYYQTDNNSDGSTLWMNISYCVHVSLNMVLGLLLKIKYDNMSIVQKQNFSFILPILKVIVNLIVHPMPWINNISIDLTYDDGDYNNLAFPLKINYLIIIPTVLKNILIIFIKIMMYTYYFGPRPARIKKLFSVGSIQELFAVKCMFKEYPIKLVFSLFVTGFAFFSIAFSIVESHVPIESNPYKYFQNCFWFTFITISTVGYGDVKIHTHIGYVLDVWCMVWGTFITSCILVVLINTLRLRSAELECLAGLKRVQGELEYNKIRKQYIRMSLWRIWKNYKHNQNREQPWVERKLRKKLNGLRRLNKTYNPTTNLPLMAQLQFNNAIINIQYLFDNNAQIIKFIGNHIFSQELSHQKIQTQKTIPDKSFIEDPPLESALTMKIQAFQCQNDEIKQQKILNMHVLRIEDLSSQDIHSNQDEQQMIIAQQ